jgi:hypothetical protein
LDGSLAGLFRPAAEIRSIILYDQANPGSHIRYSTNSMTAVGAPSPRLRPVRVMRV